MTDTVVVLNPASGSGDHADTVHDLAATYGYAVRETEAAGDTVDLTRDAVAEGASTVVAAGGDGTLNEVVRAVDDVDALDDVTVGVVPCGTGNNFAGNVGITGIEQAFEVLEDGERRRIDLGVADGHTFLNSCICGLTAEGSADTDHELKHRFGRVAYVLGGLEEARSFDGIQITVEAYDDAGDDPIWRGSAVAVLVGNGRRFPPGGSAQGNLEDGKFDVVVVEETGTFETATKAAAEALLSHDTDQTTRFKQPALTIEVAEDSPVSFSLDGEILERSRLSLWTRPKALRFVVGDGYDPDPES